MASYDDLPTIIGEIKRAAIDLHMKEQGFVPWPDARRYRRMLPDESVMIF